MMMMAMVSLCLIIVSFFFSKKLDIVEMLTEMSAGLKELLWGFLWKQTSVNCVLCELILAIFCRKSCLPNASLHAAIRYATWSFFIQPFCGFHFIRILCDIFCSNYSNDVSSVSVSSFFKYSHLRAFYSRRFFFSFETFLVLKSLPFLSNPRRWVLWNQGFLLLFFLELF